MTIDASIPTLSARGRPRWLAGAAALLAAFFGLQAVAQAPAAPGGTAPPPAADELEQLVGRVALYPDDLVAIILPASINPLQIVQADRFLEKRKTDKNAKVDDDWEDSVKALVNYPDVVKMMSNDLDWTAALGEAVATDSAEVMGAVQAFRRKVNAVGNLKTDEKQKVVVEQQIIKIEQANPEVIYVPQYNPSTVVVYGGYSSWGYYPAPYPVYYYPYPPGAAFAAGIVWGAAMGAVWNGGHWNCGWGGNEININRNTNVNVGGDRTNIGNRPSQGGGSSQQWKSSKQPGEVGKSVGKTSSTRVGDPRGGAGGAGAGTRDLGGAGSGSRDYGGAGAGTRDLGGAGSGSRDYGAAGASTRDAGSFGSASSSASRSAFDSHGSSARSAQMSSSRGSSSRSSMGRGGGGRGRR